MLFIWFGVNANPGWIKYPDSHFYLNVAMSWADGNPVINDGSGAFVRPVAYAIQGIGYALGGFDGLYLFTLAFSLGTIFHVVKSKNAMFLSLLMLLITSSIFFRHSNNILLQLPALSFVLMATNLGFKSDIRSYLTCLATSTVLLFGVFVHGGVVFLWLAYLAALGIKSVQTRETFSPTFFASILIRLGILFSMLFILLFVFELYFDSQVFDSFFRERGFSNNGSDYWVGSFFVEYLYSLSKGTGVHVWLIWLVFITAVIRLFFSMAKRVAPNFVTLWLVLFLLCLELLTFTGIMNRSASAGEYYRVYFNSYPLFLYVAYAQMGFFIKHVSFILYKPLSTIIFDEPGIASIKFEKSIAFGLKLLVILIILFFSQKSFFDSIHVLEKSHFNSVREYLKNTTNVNEKALILPANVYRHRKFFTHEDFSELDVTYYGDHCFNDTDEPPQLSEFDRIIVVKNKRLVDKRINNKLIENGCSPDYSMEKLLGDSEFTKSVTLDGIEIYDL